MSADAEDGVFTPEWAGAWEVTRWLWVLTACFAHVAKLRSIPDAYASSDMVFTVGLWHLADYVRFTPGTAYAIWAVGLLGIVLAAWGGRLLKPGIVVFQLMNWALLTEEALNVKAHDRLFLWVSLALLLSPASERGLFEKWRSPASRWLLLLVFMAIYGSTGILKLVHEPGWLDGSVLQLHLVSPFAYGPLAAFVSGHRWLCLPMCWWTLFFEIGFPFLVVWKRTNPWLLLLGIGFHTGLLAMMYVGPFALVAWTAYPVLLHPDVGRQVYLRFRELSRPRTS